MYGNVWSETTAGTDSGAIATHAAASNVQHFVTGVSGHTDKDSLITNSDGTTVVWQSKIDISLQGFTFVFPDLTIPCTPGNLAKVVLAESTADAQVNLQGYSIP